MAAGSCSHYEIGRTWVGERSCVLINEELEDALCGESKAANNSGISL